MADFTLDTSGAVPAVDGGVYYFAELPPFAQGYITEAAANRAKRPAVALFAFSDLAPETLAAMLKDCEAFRARLPGWDHHDGGALFWRNRQSGFGPVGAKHWPPVALYLGDDGLIYQREAGQ